MNKIININMGEAAVSHNDTKIRTGGIGSCVIVILYDPEKKVGGMSHSVLPTRRDRDRSPFSYTKEEITEPKSAAKYADESVDYLIKEIQKIGGRKERLIAKLVGGAMTFKILGDSKNNIGKQNVESAKQRLINLGIPIEGEDTGGTVGRIAELNLENGLVDVMTKI
jgi:chemotaxis protein CheD